MKNSSVISLKSQNIDDLSACMILTYASSTLKSGCSRNNKVLYS